MATSGTRGSRWQQPTDEKGTPQDPDCLYADLSFDSAASPPPRRDMSEVIYTSLFADAANNTPSNDPSSDDRGDAYNDANPYEEISRPEPRRGRRSAGRTPADGDTGASPRGAPATRARRSSRSRETGPNGGGGLSSAESNGHEDEHPYADISSDPPRRSGGDGGRRGSGSRRDASGRRDSGAGRSDSGRRESGSRKGLWSSQTYPPGTRASTEHPDAIAAGAVEDPNAETLDISLDYADGKAGLLFRETRLSMLPDGSLSGKRVVAIGFVKPGEAAEKTGKFLAGMRVIAVNGKFVEDRGARKSKAWVADELRLAENHAVLTVAAAPLPHMVAPEAAATPLLRSRSTVNRSRSWSPVTVGSGIASPESDSSSLPSPLGTPNLSRFSSQRSSLSPGRLVRAEGAVGSGEEFAVATGVEGRGDSLNRAPRSKDVVLSPDGTTKLGFTIREGREFYTPDPNDPSKKVGSGKTTICISNITPGGLADRSGRLRVGHRILQINGAAIESKPEKKETKHNAHAMMQAVWKAQKPMVLTVALLEDELPRPSLRGSRLSRATSVPLDHPDSTPPRSRSSSGRYRLKTPREVDAETDGAAAEGPGGDGGAEGQARGSAGSGGGRFDRHSPERTSDKVTERVTVMGSDLYSTVNVTRRSGKSNDSGTPKTDPGSTSRPAAVYSDDPNDSPFRSAAASSRGGGGGGAAQPSSSWGSTHSPYAEVGDDSPPPRTPSSPTTLAVPLLVRSCIRWLGRGNRLATEGIFREGGAEDHIALLTTAFASGDDPLEGGTAPEGILEHDVASAMKRFLRDHLDEPLLGHGTAAEWLAIAKMPAGAPQCEAGKALLLSGRVPRSGVAILLCLLPFLQRVVDEAEVNKMSVKNVAVVFGPTLLPLATSGLETLDYAMNAGLINAVTAFLIEQQHAVLPSVDEAAALPDPPPRVRGGTARGDGAPSHAIAPVLTRCVQWLSVGDRIEAHGIFREKGNLDEIEAIVGAYRGGRDALAPSAPGVDSFDVFSVAQALVRHLSEAEYLPGATYAGWLEVAQMQTADDQVASARHILRTRVPAGSLAALGIVLPFLHKVTQHSGTNRMAAQALSFAVGQSLLPDPITPGSIKFKTRQDEDKFTQAQHARVVHGNRAVRLLIELHARVFDPAATEDDWRGTKAAFDPAQVKPKPNKFRRTVTAVKNMFSSDKKRKRSLTKEETPPPRAESEPTSFTEETPAPIAPLQPLGTAAPDTRPQEPLPTQKPRTVGPASAAPADDATAGGEESAAENAPTYVTPVPVNSPPPPLPPPATSRGSAAHATAGATGDGDPNEPSSGEHGDPGLQLGTEPPSTTSGSPVPPLEAVPWVTEADQTGAGGGSSLSWQDASTVSGLNETPAPKLTARDNRRQSVQPTSLPEPALAPTPPARSQQSFATPRVPSGGYGRRDPNAASPGGRNDDPTPREVVRTLRLPEHGRGGTGAGGRPNIGVSLVPFRGYQVVSTVVRNSPAEIAGIEVADVFFSVGDVQLGGMSSAAAEEVLAAGLTQEPKAVNDCGKGDGAFVADFTRALQMARDLQRQRDNPQTTQPAQVAVVLYRGLPVVAAVAPGSAAEKLQLERGQVLLAIGGIRVEALDATVVAAMMNVLWDQPTQVNVDLMVMNQQTHRHFAASLAEAETIAATLHLQAHPRGAGPTTGLPPVAVPLQPHGGAQPARRGQNGNGGRQNPLTRARRHPAIPTRGTALVVDRARPRKFAQLSSGGTAVVVDRRRRVQPPQARPLEPVTQPAAPVVEDPPTPSPEQSPAPSPPLKMRRRERRRETMPSDRLAAIEEIKEGLRARVDRHPRDPPPETATPPPATAEAPPQVANAHPQAAEPIAPALLTARSSEQWAHTRANMCVVSDCQNTSNNRETRQRTSNET
eukprot:m.95667 g.95667  ORF g.95667 m.95667 type:complete len:1890 (+) comp12336_c0_seq1:2158-7827(+)